MANIQHYSFWLWQYEVRSEKPIQEKTFRNHNYADPTTVNLSSTGVEYTNKIPPDTMLQAIIENKFTPCGPSISSEKASYSCINLSKNYHESDIFVAIKYTDPIEKIIPEIKMLIAMQRIWALNVNSNNIDDASHQNKDIMSIYRKAEDELNAYFVKDRPNIHKEGTKRALGLWLFDYCNEHSCGCPTADAALRKTDYLQQLNYEKDPRHFARLLKNTRACIAECEVLPIG